MPTGEGFSSSTLPLDPAASSCLDFGFLPNLSPCFLPLHFFSLFFIKKYYGPIKKIGQMCPNFTGSKSLCPGNLSGLIPSFFAESFPLILLFPLPAVLPQVTLWLQFKVPIAGPCPTLVPHSAHHAGQLPILYDLLPPMPTVPV